MAVLSLRRSSPRTGSKAGIARSSTASSRTRLTSRRSSIRTCGGKRAGASAPTRSLSAMPSCQATCPCWCPCCGSICLGTTKRHRLSRSATVVLRWRQRGRETLSSGGSEMGESTTDVTKIETESQLQACGLQLQITGYAWDKLMAYCRATNLEVSGFMLMVKDGPIMTIKDAYIVDQECTGTSTEMASTAIARLQMELFKKKIIGQDDNVKLAHFHTHCTFGVFWSGTDMELRRTMVAGTDYSVALVINHKGEALAAIDINGDFPLSISNLPIESVREESELVKACKAEVEAKVHAPAVTQYYTGAGHWDYELGTYALDIIPPSDALRQTKPNGMTWAQYRKAIKAEAKERRRLRDMLPA